MLSVEQFELFLCQLRQELAAQAEQAEGIEATVIGRVLEAVRRAEKSALGRSNMRALAVLDLVNALDEAGRKQSFIELSERFCLDCGRALAPERPRCYCENDE